MPDTRLTLLAVGWLEPDAPHEKGKTDAAFFARLIDFLEEPWQPFAAAGRHPCGFCRLTGGPTSVSVEPERGPGLSVDVGIANLFVPGRDVLYMAPSLIVHFIDAHEYKPPYEFVEAVMACPEMRSAAYLRAIHAVGAPSC